MLYLDTLARFASEVSLARLGEAATTAARLALLDTLGAMLAGSAQPENVRLARAMAERASRPAATLIGHDARVDPLLATLVNATAGVAPRSAARRNARAVIRSSHRKRRAAADAG